MGVVAADFDGDHDVDSFFATTGATPATLLLNDGKGHFTAKTTGLPALFGTSQTAIAIDYDGDGATDLLTTGTAPSATAPPGIVLLANRGASFVDVTAKALVGGSFPTTGVAAADVDHDGDVDSSSAPRPTHAGSTSTTARACFSTARSTPSRPTSSAPACPPSAILDGDGFVDLYIPSSGQDRVLINDGTGRFQDLTPLRLGDETANGVSATIVDLDQDGHADVVVVEQPGALRLYRNDGTGRLFDYSGQVVGVDGLLVTAGAAVGDFDGDGDPDLFISHGGGARPSLLTNWAPLSSADADGDGVPDTADNCPAIANASQANLDSEPFRCDSAASCKAATGCDLHVFRSSAYLACSGAKSWSDAEAACVARGAHLVTIGDAAEDAFLAQSAPAGFWTGGNDNAVHGTWVWTGGTSSYVDWAKSQPDDSLGAEHCIQVVADGTWNDLDCAQPEPYVCEDVRARAPDPGDACDPCPNDYDPKDGPLASIPDAGADGAAKADAGTCP